MSDNWTATTEWMRFEWVAHHEDDEETFDRWLAEHEEQVRAEERERIARAIEAQIELHAPPVHNGGLRRAARIARGGGAS